MKIGAAKWFKSAETFWSVYMATGETALILISDEGEKLCTATVCLEEGGPLAEDGQVWLKGWSENEGVPEALAAAGVVVLTETFHPTGYARAQLATLTPEAIAERDAAMPPEMKAAQVAAREVTQIIKGIS